MSVRERNSGSESVGDKLVAVLDALSRFVLVAGGLAALIGIAFLIYNYTATSGVTGALAKQVTQNISLFGLLAVAGLSGVALAVTYLNWGEEVLGPLLLIAWAIFFFSPLYLPSMLGAQSGNKLGQLALETLQRSSIPLGAIGLLVVVVDVISRARTRSREGAKADQIKLGKGLKEERDIRNVFMGKCWQLPYCRKFVRERCPIYHARRSCWKERVGCMCEESVIRNAMEGRVIPSDAVAAAKYIPQNTKLTPDQKAERCRSCVIFNEHQKHKYKLAMPIAIGGTALMYVVFHEPMANGVQGMMGGINKFVNTATLNKEGNKDLKSTGLGTGDIAFNEVILVALLVVGMAYLIRMLEYLIFKAKI